MKWRGLFFYSVSPRQKKSWVYCFYAGREDPDEYTFHDKVPPGISDQRCAVDFSKVLKYMEEA